MASNYDDVRLQISNFGLVVGRLEVGRMVRCHLTDDKEKRGWYIIHEVTLSGGDTALVGSYGIWQGSDANAQKIELSKVELTGEQKAAIRERMAEDRKRAINEQKHRAEKAALQADKAWRHLQIDGDSDYLHIKGIAAHGIRFTKENAIAIPMLDTSGRIWGLQFILNKTTQKDKIDKLGGRNKIFWPTGCAKKEHFHLIGSPTNLLLIAEGYATAASLHAATGFAVAVAFDANNLAPVAKALKRRYNCNILICADDDSLAYCAACSKPININLSNICPECHKPHKKNNQGAIQAELAALGVSGRFITPRFSDQAARLDYYARCQGKLTDFNDLHAIEGLHTVRTQVESALMQYGWSGAPKARAHTQGGSGADDRLNPIDTTDELLERFSLVYGKGGTVFDNQEHQLLVLSDMRDACMSRETHRRWQESPQRNIVRAENVGFDPGENDKKITCNLWGGWPTQPKAGICDKLIALLYHMCSGEDNASDAVKWVIKWFAYPIQHPGAKMRTCLVIHGPQGTGKNLFCEVIMAIYGRYGRIIDQAAVEDKFNDCFSAILFMIADETIARSDLYHVKNKIKGLITGVKIRINPKNRASYEENNHVNIVFLSNERVPVLIEEGDRRHFVIWTPEKKEAAFYTEVSHEIDNGGVEALHDWLLNIDLGDFDEHTKPPMTVAKEELLALSKDNVLRFWDDFIAGEFHWTSDDYGDDKAKTSNNTPMLSEDLYELYKAWCQRQGVRFSPLNRMIDHIVKRPGVHKERKRFNIDNRDSANPRTIIYPPNGLEMPIGKIEKIWLGSCVQHFKKTLNIYKGAVYD
jgi:putative DNA primase/helicase